MGKLNVKRAKQGHLSPAHKVFVREYIATNNASTAYQKAFKLAKPAPVSGYKLLQSETIKREIERIVGPKMKELEVTANRTIEGMARVAFLDPRRAFKADGTTLPIHELPDDVAFAVSSVKMKQTDTGVIFEYRFDDRCKAQESLAKHFGIFKPEEVKHDHRVTISIEI